MLPPIGIPRVCIGGLLPLVLTGCLVGCSVSNNVTPASGSTTTTTTFPITAPTIVTQPASLTVPIGLKGIFTVTITGGGTLTEQWFRNGVAIPGATSITYTTPAVAATDTGAVLTFAVTNSAGTSTSQPAVLTAGARAPAAGDLRFQQVDALSTITGYAAYDHTALSGLSRALYGGFSGSPLWLESGDCIAVASVIPGIGCEWEYSVYNLPANTPALAVGYFGDLLSNFETDLAAGEFPSTQFGGGPITASNNVVTSLAMNTVNGLFALSYVQSVQSNAGGFNLVQRAILPTDIQTAATGEGQSSRVITAVAFDSGQLIYFSYGWTGDTTVYETLTATATFATAGTVAASLAAQGYIITAFGGDDADGLVMVGTRVMGDTLPRQILVASGTQLAQTQAQILAQGYAVVGAVETQAGNSTTLIEIGER
jgi:hypothetical protein